jgi:hypothetical protein
MCQIKFEYTMKKKYKMTSLNFQPIFKKQCFMIYYFTLLLATLQQIPHFPINSPTSFKPWQNIKLFHLIPTDIWVSIGHYHVKQTRIVSRKHIIVRE